MAFNCFKPVLDHLESTSSGDFNHLRLVRTFCMCGGHWGNGVEPCESALLRIDYAFLRYASEIQFLSLRLKDDDDGGGGGRLPTTDAISYESLGSTKSCFGVSEFLACIASFRQEIEELYLLLSDVSLQTAPPRGDQLVDIISSLLENLQYLPYHNLPEDFRKAIDVLEQDVRFSKNLIHLVTMRGLDYMQMQDLLVHIGGFIVNASRLTYISWISKNYADLPGKIWELVQKFRPAEPHVNKIFVQVLLASKLSQSFQVLAAEREKCVLRDLIDSLLCYLWELLNSGTSCTVPFENQMLKLYEQLGSFRTKFDELHENLRDLFGVMICEVGIVVCSLFMKENQEALTKELDHMFLDLLEKFKRTDSVMAEKYPLTSASYFPRASTEVQEVAETSLSSIPEFNEVVGFQDEAQKIIDRLERGTKELDIISIVGMPGLGKSTLARKIYEDDSITHHFNHRSWCTVSQAYTKKTLLLQILGGIAASEESEDDLAQRLYRHLKGKRYLVVLDDVWDKGAWNAIQIPFLNQEANNGSRILLTSRNGSVASQIKPDSEPHFLRPLNSNECWELLRKKMFYQRYCPPELDAFGMRIAQNCKGLPLTVVLVAGILANTEQGAWEKIAESLNKDTVDQCMSTLELSYSHLPNHLKPCFLYFGTFQEDQEIPCQGLLWRWIAEGFVKETAEKRFERVAEDYLMDLIRRSLVMAAKKGSLGRVRTCIIHDLLRDFCQEKAKEKNFFQYLGVNDELSKFNEPNTSSQLCLYSTRDRLAKARVFYPSVQSLRIVADESRCAGHWCNVFYIFRLFKLLRVLDLVGTSLGKYFPREIELLVHLRYLAIESSIQRIPSSIDHLLNLETFLLYGGHVSLPDTIWSMKKLRHLCLTSRGYWKFPGTDLEDSSSLENLRTLSWLYISTDNVLKRLSNIRKLKCKLFLRDCKVLAMDFLEQLESLSLYQGDYHHVIRDLEFGFPPNLKKLVLSKLCLPWSKLSALAELKMLEVLKTQENAFIGKTWEMEETVVFRSLRILKLKELCLFNWTASEDNFWSLQKLTLEQCPCLIDIPSCLGYLATLDIIEVAGCDSATSSIEQIQKEQTDNENLKIFVHSSRRIMT